MSKIEDLRASMEGKTDAELIEELRGIRLSRRTPKTKTGAVKKKKESKLVINFDTMTKQQAQDFLKTLEGGEPDETAGD